MRIVIRMKDGNIEDVFTSAPNARLKVITVDTNEPAGNKPEVEELEVQPLDKFEMPPWFKNHYRCDRCGNEWADEWSAQCDDDCPSCGARHMSPHDSDDLTPDL